MKLNIKNDRLEIVTETPQDSAYIADLLGHDKDGGGIEATLSVNHIPTRDEYSVIIAKKDAPTI